MGDDVRPHRRLGLGAGDPGSGFLNASGQAIGVLSGLQLVPGTAAFKPNLIEAILGA